ncbi:MAG: leucyl aminopeptidase [Actinobacteria bacterium]|nr:leucyl aminopeptidase [Actinomycetota bacterium]
MRSSRSTATAATVKADVLIVPVTSPAKPLPATLSEADAALGGTVADAITRREFTPKPGSVLHVHSGGRIAPRALLVVGVGEGDIDAWRSAGLAAGRAARGVGATRAAVQAPDDAARAGVFLTAIGEGNYRFSRFRGDANGPPRGPISRLSVLGGPLAKADLAAADRLVDAIVGARDLVNTPGNHLTPSKLAEYAQDLAERTPGLVCEVLDEPALHDIGAGALLSVAQGSAQSAKLITLRYQPAGASSDAVLGLVGKAVTFDTGGISIKPAGGMEDMKMDMGGGAAVIEATALIASLGLPINVVAVVPATENMPGSRAVKPGDVVTALNGKTIEIRNTDAEGRLILADALTYCARQGATRMIDLATLTGAIVVALGEVYSGLFGSDPEWTEMVRAAGEASGDLVWPMPLHRRYDPLIRSKVADLSNAANKRQAGPIYAAQFLREFAEGLPWCHVDIAGTGMIGGAGTGVGVRLIAEVARTLSEV